LINVQPRPGRKMALRFASPHTDPVTDESSLLTEYLPIVKGNSPRSSFKIQAGSRCCTNTADAMFFAPYPLIIGKACQAYITPAMIINTNNKTRMRPMSFFAGM